MAVTSTTLSGVSVFQFSGAVTDAEIKAAWALLIVNGVYVINRAIYLDNTADLTGVTGGFLVDHGTAVLPAFILHTGRDKTKSTFNNFTFLQRVGLTVPQRVGFVQTWNGTTFANQGAGLGTDGLSQRGGGFVYGVPGAGTGGDPRFLNEMPFTGLEGATIYSQEFTEQELQVVLASSNTLKGITFEKAYGFPQIGTPTSSVNVVVYRSTQNTQSTANGGLIPIRLFPSGGRYASVCYVDSYVTRNNADINTRLIDTFGTNPSNVATIMVLNNYTRESWFGASKTNIPVTTWVATNAMWGGILKKLRFVNGGGATIRAYDSRSTTVAQKCSFQETGTSDFLNVSLAPTTDANGQISLVHIGALAQGAGAPITRYTNQRYTYQKFGQRVSVTSVDMTQGGDNDLSAFTPVIPVTQEGLARTQAVINASTTITSFQDLLEELHVLAIGLSGSASYAGAFDGNLFSYIGTTLTTQFTTVNIDPLATNKIAYDPATNTLTVKSSVLSANSTVSTWNNATGSVNLQNGAAIQGVYVTLAGTSTEWQFQQIQAGTSLAIYDATGTTKFYQAVTTPGTYSYYIAPGVTGTYTYGIEKYGTRREEGTFPAAAGGILFYVPGYQEDVGITETDAAIVAGYSTIENNEKLYDRTALFRLTEAGIKRGQIGTRAGTSIEFGEYSGIVKSDATAVYSITGNTITIKANGLAGTTKYDTIIATAPATWEGDSTEVITTDIEDGNGNSSVNIQASGDNTFEVWKIADAVNPDNYATGTLLATVGIGKYRFIGVDGFKLVIRDTVTNFRVVTEMEKGVYEAALYFGAAVQLAQAAEVTQINNKVDLLTIDVNAIKGTGFATGTDSLSALSEKNDAVQTSIDSQCGC